MKGMLKICKIWRLVCLGHWKRQAGVTNDTWLKPLVWLTEPLFNIIWNFYRGIRYTICLGTSQVRAESHTWNPILDGCIFILHIQEMWQFNQMHCFSEIMSLLHITIGWTKQKLQIEFNEYKPAHKNKGNKFFLKLCLHPKVWPTLPMQM